MRERPWRHVGVALQPPGRPDLRHDRRAQAAAAARGRGGELEITAAERARGLTFDAGVAPRDREWILAAVAKARPEAARLIDEVDGLVTVKTFADPDAWALGWAQIKGVKRYELRLNVSRLNGSRRIDRDMVTLHELGHVIDFAILDDAACATGSRPRCPRRASAMRSWPTARTPQERFADTFAKWALRGAVSITGAGYSLPAPASLEDWARRSRRSRSSSTSAS